jgi:hypothetical protein
MSGVRRAGARRGSRIYTGPVDIRTRAARRSRPPVGSRYVLLASLLAVAVVLAVLTMHSLHLHAGTASPPSSHTSGASVSEVSDAVGTVGGAHAAGHSAAGHQAAEHHAVGTHGAGTHGAGTAVAGAGVGMQEHDDGAAGDAGCTTCPADHLGLAMTCLVALLLGLALVVRPRTWVLSSVHGARGGPMPGRLLRVLPRPPTLTALCISRT